MSTYDHMVCTHGRRVGIDKYLIQGVDLYIKLYRSSHPFVMMSGEVNPNYKLQIMDAVFKTCKVKVDSGVVVNHVMNSPVSFATVFFFLFFFLSRFDVESTLSDPFLSA
jgi:hypothetical protein